MGDKLAGERALRQGFLMDKAVERFKEEYPQFKGLNDTSVEVMTSALHSFLDIDPRTGVQVEGRHKQIKDAAVDIHDFIIWRRVFGVAATESLRKDGTTSQFYL